MISRCIPIVAALIVVSCSKPTPPATPRGLSAYHRADSAKLSADEAKASSIAKAHLEKSDGKPVDAYFKVTMTDAAYEVQVFYVTGYDDTGEPIFIPGGHCTVLISKQWEVTKVLPGA